MDYYEQALLQFRPCSVEPGTPLCKKMKRKDKNKKGDEIDDLLTRNLKTIERTCAGLEDEEELFGRHVVANLRHFTARQKEQAKICIQGILMETEFPEQPYAPPPLYYQPQ